jgi:hypothetical protein
MSEQEELFTKDQNRLMSIAGWANNLAWVALIFYLLLAAATIFIDQANYQRLYFSRLVQDGFDYWEMFSSNPVFYFLDLVPDILRRLLTGFIYYVVLKGISLGLYMVIETDMNYRQREDEKGEAS